MDRAQSRRDAAEPSAPPQRPPRPNRLPQQTAVPPQRSTSMAPPQLPPAVSARSDIDFDSMLQELLAAESMVSQRLSVGAATDTAASAPNAAAANAEERHAAQPQTPASKSVLFVDEATHDELVARLSIASVGSVMHLPVQAAAVTVPAGAAADLQRKSSGSLAQPSVGAHDKSASNRPSASTPLASSAPPIRQPSLTGALPHMPVMEQTVEFDEEAPTLQISHPDLVDPNQGVVASLASSSSIASLRSAVPAAAETGVPASSASRGSAADLRLLNRSSQSSLTQPQPILKVKQPAVEPDILPMQPDLDAEDDVDSDEYREIYGDDYDRYNIYSSGDEEDDDDDEDDDDNQQVAEDDRPDMDENGRDEDIELQEDDDGSVPPDANDGLDAFRQQQTPADGASPSSLLFQNATLDDYEDVDGLLSMLDKFIRRHRASRIPSISDFNAQSQSARQPVKPAGATPVPLALRTDSLQHQQKSAASQQRQTNAQPSLSDKRSDAAQDDSDEDDMALGILANNLKAKAQEDKNSATMSRTSSASSTSLSRQPEPQTHASLQPQTQQEKVNLILAKLNEANVKKITTRIYIEDARSFKTLVLTSLMSADQVVRDVIERFRLEPSADWTLFELCNDMGIERPLRDWETVTDVISAWDLGNSLNAIVMKKYGYRITLQANSLNGRFPRVQGYLYLEHKPGKWHKRFCVLKDSQLYYYQEANKPSTETLLCNLSNYDVYTLSQRKRKTPTEFCFALRSIHNVSVFENRDEYSKFICVEKRERLYDWVLALRLARNEQQFLDFPELFEEYDGMISAKAKKRRAAAKGEKSVSSSSDKRADSQRLSTDKSASPHAEPRKLAHARVERSPSDDASRKGLHQQASSDRIVSDDDYRREKERRRAQRATASTTSSLSSSAGGDHDETSPLINEDDYRREKERRRRERQEREARRSGSSSAANSLAGGARRSHRDDALSPTSDSAASKTKTTPLVDVSDAKNCRQCGCSDFRPLRNRKETCANCSHVHL